MKVTILVLSYFVVHSSCAFTTSRIEGIDGLPQKVTIDSNGNVYVGVNDIDNDLRILYKLSPSKEPLWNIPLPNSAGLIQELHATKDNDIYVISYDFNTLNNTLFVLKSDTENLLEIGESPYGAYFIDNNGNFFYDQENGVQVLRRNTTVPVPVKNLENVLIYGTDRIAVVDSSGNVYFGISNQVAVITSESLQDVPSATLIQLASDDMQVVSLLVDGSNDLWISLTDNLDSFGFIKTLTNGVLNPIHTDKNNPVNRFLWINDTIFVVAGDFTRFSSSIYCIKGIEITEIPELKNLSTEYSFVRGLADSEGNTYFFTRTGTEFSPELGSMITKKAKELVFHPIEFEAAAIIDSVALDFNDDLWITTENQALFYLKKGDFLAQKINLTSTCSDYLFSGSGLTVNWVAKEIYVSCRDGLYEIVQL